MRAAVTNHAFGGRRITSGSFERATGSSWSAAGMTIVLAGGAVLAARVAMAPILLIPAINNTACIAAKPKG
jgi:hypothetical protein